jgi:uroporphyrinogen-III synthase
VRLLVTRPPPDGARTADALRERGYDALEAPMLRMETLATEIADRAYAGVVMTSANAARALAGHPQCAQLARLPAFTVGAHTAAVARAIGFAEVHCAHGDRTDLAALLHEHVAEGLPPLLYLAGEDRAGDLAPPGTALVTAVIYRMVKAARFPDAVVGALAGSDIDGVLHYSRRSAQAYVECAKRAALLDASLKPTQLCLSHQAAKPLAAEGAAGIRIAAQPNEAAMLALVDAEAAKLG